MIYKAVVLDNSNFFKIGTIRVRIAGYFHRKASWNLEEDFPASIDEGVDGEKHKDFNAILYSPFGGGRNYGMLIIPQINEKGIVSFLGDNKRKPVWMGSIFEPKYGANHKIEYTNIPSDDPESEGADSDGSVNEEHNMKADSDEDALKKNIVIRTKNTSRDDGIDWEDRPTTNIISIGEKGMTWTHFSEDGGYSGNSPKKWQEIKSYINDDGEDVISIKVNNDTSSKTAEIEITDTEIRFLGVEDNLVTHADLAEFLNTFLDHQHVSPNGPTIGLIDGTQKPLIPELSQLISKFKAENLKTE